MSNDTREHVDQNYFEPEEFQGWYMSLHEALQPMLNKFRHRWGRPVHVSKAPGAVGRVDDSRSCHNVAHWDSVMAIDLFPEGMTTPEEMKRAQNIAEEVGFTGIGLYTDTKGNDGEFHPMIHLDIRNYLISERIARWSRVNGEYLAIEQAFTSLEGMQQ